MGILMSCSFHEQKLLVRREINKQFGMALRVLLRFCFFFVFLPVFFRLLWSFLRRAPWWLSKENAKNFVPDLCSWKTSLLEMRKHLLLEKMDTFLGAFLRKIALAINFFGLSAPEDFCLRNSTSEVMRRKGELSQIVSVSVFLCRKLLTLGATDLFLFCWCCSFCQILTEKTALNDLSRAKMFL